MWGQHDEAVMEVCVCVWGVSEDVWLVDRRERDRGRLQRKVER